MKTYKQQIIMVYTWHKYTVICQVYLNFLKNENIILCQLWCIYGPWEPSLNLLF